MEVILDKESWWAAAAAAKAEDIMPSTIVVGPNEAEIGVFSLK
jgi:hypothetical protein